MIYTASTARLAQYLASELRTRGLEAATHEIPDAEAGKTGEVAAGCWAHLGQLDFTRSDVVVGVGGER